MRLGDVFERFLQQAPISVMFRALLERALDPDELNRLFEQTATTQYTRELLFSSLVNLMGLVVCGVHPSVRSAYLASLGEISASLTAVYEKLQGIEPGVCRGLVRDTAGRLLPLVSRLDASLPDLVPGYRAKILDGNHLAATEHRIKATRATHAAALPGQALVVLDPATMLVIDVAPCEDAHAQERSLVDQVLPGVEPGDLWIADRNFCTTRFLFGVRAGAGASWSDSTGRRCDGSRRRPDRVGRVATGFVQEQTIRVTEVDGDGVMELRRIRLELDQPTRDKETELFLLTDLPPGQRGRLVGGRDVPPAVDPGERLPEPDRGVELRDRHAGLPEGGVVRVLHGVGGVQRPGGDPCGVAVGARADEVEGKVSNYHLVQEVATTYAGMMIAVPPSELGGLPGVSEGQMAEFLREAAGQAWLAKYPRSKHGPKKPRPKRTGRFSDHVATARLLGKQDRHE